MRTVARVDLDAMQRLMLLALLSLLLLPAIARVRSVRYRQIESIKRDFVTAVASATVQRSAEGRHRPKAFVLDVGANVGTFSQRMMQNLKRAAPSADVRLVMFEPQPQFRALLGALADLWKGVHMPAAAWIETTNLTFHINANNSERATAQADDVNEARGFLPGSRIVVPAVDLADYLLQTLPSTSADPAEANASLVFLKIDVEGSEYDLLPKLLGSNALCRVRFLLVEWHLKLIAPSKREAGLALKTALASILAGSCSLPPRVVHDDIPTNNANLDIPQAVGRG